MAASLEEIEARVAALEAEHADYRAVLMAINALGANQREIAERVYAVEERLGGVEERLGGVERAVDDSSHRIRALEENTAEIKDLLIRALDR